MATVTSHYVGHAPVVRSKTERVATVLRWTYVLFPIVAGADKITHMLTNWNKYLASGVTDVLQISANTFMGLVGVIEMIAGLIVLSAPRVGSLIVGLWL